MVTRYADVAALLKERVLLGTDLHAVRGYDAARPFGAGSALERFQEGLLINLARRRAPARAGRVHAAVHAGAAWRRR